MFLLPYSFASGATAKVGGFFGLRLLVTEEILPHLTTLVSALAITCLCRESHRLTNLTGGKLQKGVTGGNTWTKTGNREKKDYR